MSRVRLGLFLALCVAQLAVPLSMAYRYERTLREGTVYRFHTEPFDPVDAFRGRYVAIRLRLVMDGEPKLREGSDIYAVLQRDREGYAAVREILEARPAGGDWLRGKITSEFRSPADGGSGLSTRIELPFDRYYMEESKAPEADRLWSEGMRQAEASARVRVRKGLGAIEGLDVHGVPIEQWIATLPARE